MTCRYLIIHDLLPNCAYVGLSRTKLDGKKKSKDVKGIYEGVLFEIHRIGFKMYAMESSSLSQEERNVSANDDLTDHGGTLVISGLLFWMLRLKTPSAQLDRA